MPPEAPLSLPPGNDIRIQQHLGDSSQILYPTNLLYLPEYAIVTNPKTGEQREIPLHPFNPMLTGAIVGLLESFITEADQALARRVGHISYPDAQRSNSDDLLKVGIPVQAVEGHSIILGYSGGVTKKNLEDTHTEINAHTDPTYGVQGQTVVSYMYFEGRDDRPDIQSRAPDQLSRDVRLTAASSQRRLAGATLWEPHSTATIDKLRGMYPDEEMPVIPLTAVRLFADRFREEGFVDESSVVLSPDLGALERAQAFANELNVPLVFADKTRPGINESDIEGYYQYFPEDGGDFKQVDPNTFFDGRTVLAIDDMGDTVGTQKKSLGKVKSDYHAARVGSAFTHAIFSPPTASINLREAMDGGAIDLMLITDSLPSHNNFQHENIKVVSLAAPTASLVKVIAGVGSDEDRSLVARCRYFPTKNKFQLLAEFNNGAITPNGHTPTPEGGNIVLFRRQQQVA